MRVAAGDRAAGGYVTGLADAPPLAWERLLEAGERDDRLVATSVEPAAGAAHGRGARRRSRPRSRRRSRAPGSRSSTRTSSRRSRRRGTGDVIVTSGTASGKSLSFNLPVLDALAADPKTPGALPLPDQGPGPGPGAEARRSSGLPRAPPRDLRRRHAARTTGPRSAGARTWSSPTRTCSTWRSSATTRAGATSSPTCGWVVVDEAHTYRGRLRLARRQRAAPPAPGRPRLRRRAALHLRLGDDRQPGRARRAASSAPSSRWSTPTAPRAPSAGSRSGTRR